MTTFYGVPCLGVAVGFHRLSTHGSFQANRGLMVALALAGQLALPGPVIGWVADHRRQHAFSDREGDHTHPGGTARVDPHWPETSGMPTWGGSSTGI